MKTKYLFILFASLVMVSCDTTKAVVKSTNPKENSTKTPQNKGFVIEANLSTLDYISNQSIGGVTGAFIGDQMDTLAKSLQNDFPQASINRVGEGIELVEQVSNRLQQTKALLDFSYQNELTLVINTHQFKPKELDALQQLITNADVVYLASPTTSTQLDVGFVASKTLVQTAIEETKQ